MRAIVYERYGPPDVLELRDVPAPEVKDDEVLVRVHAASVNRSDWERLTARPAYVRFAGAGLLRPKRPILGSDVAGRVEAVGRDVTQFRPGDAVLADTLYFGMGAFAEYVAVPERAPIAHKPPGLSFEAAATLPQAALLALQGLLRKGPAAPGQRVAIVGAGGGGGSFAVQIAKSRGAEVTGVDHGGKADLMRSLGADHVVDYTRADYTRRGERYDRILDFAGGRSLRANRRALASAGVYLLVGGSVPRLLQAAVVGGLISKVGDEQMGVLVARPNKDDLSDVAERAAAGTLNPAIDRTYDLGEVPEALRRLGAGRALGKLVVTP